MSEAIVIQLKHGPFWNFSYLVACPETRSAVVIDPAGTLTRSLASASANGLTITSVLTTHGHSDHANAVAAIVRATGADVVGHKSDSADLSAHYTGKLRTFEHGDVLEIGSIGARLLHTPGHTAGSASFLAAGALFTGDTLNVGGPGTPGHEPGAIEALWESTVAVGKLEGVAWLYPGHDAGPAARGEFSEELRRNSGLSAASYEAFVEAVERSTGRRFRH